MKTTTFLTSTVVLSSMFLGTVGTAEAATLTKSYFVQTAGTEATHYHKSADHLVTLPSIVGYGGRDYVQSGNVYFDVYDNDTARFYGFVEQKNDASKQFEIDILFNYRGQGRAGQGQDKDGNKTLKRGVGGPYDTSKWDFYDIDASSKLIGRGANAHLGEIFIKDVSGGKYPMQLGLGANAKNSNFGFSSWFIQTEGFNTNTHSDFNVELVARPLPPSEPVPEPTTGLALAGLAGAGILRRKKKAASK